MAPLTTPGLVGHLYLPAGRGPFPAVLLLGGSGGGIAWQDEMGKLLAERGIASLALAYFGLEGLPPQLERIPLEYCDRALTDLESRPEIDRRRLGIGGASKGGELALLVASRHPELHAVAAFVASGIVFQSIAPGFPLTSSWSLDGRDVPFVPYGKAERGSPVVEYYRRGRAAADAAMLAAATINL
jgi:dienelactone hydrolase